MSKATLRDLRYHFEKVANLLQLDEEIQITRRGRVIARLLPPALPAQSPRPDFMERLHRIYGKKRMKVSNAELLKQERARR